MEKVTIDFERLCLELEKQGKTKADLSRDMAKNKNFVGLMEKNPDQPAVYCDKRSEEYRGIWKSVKGQSERKCVIDPDIQCDFTKLPFPDESFSLVIFDPPHLKHVGDNAWLARKYGKVDSDWPQMLHDGFRECMRVLKPDGVMIFKWSEHDIPAADVWKAIGQKPLFGHHSGKNSKTFWGCYMKGVE